MDKKIECPKCKTKMMHKTEDEVYCCNNATCCYFYYYILVNGKKTKVDGHYGNKSEGKKSIFEIYEEVANLRANGK